MRRHPSCAPPPPPPPPPPPANPDRDGDGLLNAHESQLGTNADDPDTDDDRLGDGQEVAGMVVRESFEVCGTKALGSILDRPDPLLADSDKDGIGDGVEVLGYVIKQRVVISNDGRSYVIGRTRTDPTRADTDRGSRTTWREPGPPTSGTTATGRIPASATPTTAP